MLQNVDIKLKMGSRNTKSAPIYMLNAYHKNNVCLEGISHHPQHIIFVFKKKMVKCKSEIQPILKYTILE